MSIENKACKSLLTTSKYLSDNEKQIKLMGKVHCSLESVKILVQFHKRFKMADFGKMQFGNMVLEKGNLWGKIV